MEVTGEGRIGEGREGREGTKMYSLMKKIKKKYS